LAHAGTVFYVTGADNAASLHLHAALGFPEVNLPLARCEAFAPHLPRPGGHLAALVAACGSCSSWRPGRYGHPAAFAQVRLYTASCSSAVR